VRTLCAFGLALAVLATAAPLLQAQTSGAKPSVPPATPSAGFAVGFLSAGLDYTDTDVARLIARDGEGEAIAWDTRDKDRRPFRKSADGTPPHHGGDATALARLARLRLVPVRVAVEDARSLADAVAFLARSPARIVLVPMWGRDKETWEAFRAAADALPNMLFIVAAGDEGADIDAAPVYPAGFRLPNMLVVSAIGSTDAPEKPNRGAQTVDLIVAPASALRESPGPGGQSPVNSREAVMLAGALIPCHGRELSAAKSAADAKRILVAKARPLKGVASPVIEACQR
jgi:hypothetical protein